MFALQYLCAHVTHDNPRFMIFDDGNVTIKPTHWGSTQNNLGVAVFHYLNNQYLFSHFIP